MCDLMGEEYRQDKLTVGIDADKLLDVGCAGLDTRVCDLMPVLLKRQ